MQLARCAKNAEKDQLMPTFLTDATLSDEITITIKNLLTIMLQGYPSELIQITTQRRILYRDKTIQ